MNRLYNLSIGLIISGQLLAQVKDSTGYDVNAFDHLPILNTWATTSNPAADHYQPYQEVVNTSLNYKISQGDFHAVNAPSSSQAIVFDSEGYKQVNRVNFYGHFQYLYQNDADLNYNNNLFVSSDNPFSFADTIQGKDYVTEVYKLKGRTSYQSQNLKHIWALDFEYSAGNKYCETDPRADINAIKSTFSLGYIHNLSPRWQLGVNALFGNFSEEISEEIVGNENYYFFRMKGLGLYESHLEDYGTTVLYNGYHTGLALQLKNTSDQAEFITELKLTKEVESSQNGITSAIYKTGDFIGLHPSFQQVLRFKQDDINHDFTFSARYDNNKGIWFYQEESLDYSSGTGTTVYEVLNESIIYLKESYEAGLNYRLSQMDEHLIDHYCSIGTKLQINKTKAYPYPYYENINTLSFYGAGFKRIKLKRGALSLDLSANYQKNLSEELYTQASTIAELITYPKHSFWSSDYLKLNSQITYSLMDLGSNHLNPFIALKTHYTQALGTNVYYKGEHRLDMNLSLGINL